MRARGLTSSRPLLYLTQSACPISFKATAVRAAPLSTFRCTPVSLRSRMPLSFAPPTTIPRLGEEAETSASGANGKAAAVSASIDDFKDQFNHTVQVLGLRIAASDVGRLRKGDLAKTGAILNVSRISNVVRDPAGDEHRRLLLLEAATPSEIPPDAAKWIQVQGYDVVPHTIQLTYDWYTADEVLSAILPFNETKGTPTAYATIGHIAHLNLREEYLPFRYIIGQVILQKNSIIRTVVNKLDTIDTVYRFFDMELLAGEADYVATVNESGCRLTFDFRKVYFNSRLGTEHGRIVSLLQPGEVISDVMAGVGPFAVPAAKKGCVVYANDLNPSSYESLTGNAKQNRTAEGCKTYCEDGRGFIKESVKRAWRREITGWTGVKSAKERAKAKNLQQQGPASVKAAASLAPPPPPSRLIDHFIMNLPDSALTFLDAYRGAYKALAEAVGIEAVETEMASKQLPMVHVHTFTKDLEDPHGDVCRRANEALGLAEDHPDRLVPLPSPKDAHNSNSRQRRVGADAVVTTTDPARANPTRDLSLHWVRTVSPNKDMWCLSFRLPRSVVFDER